MSVSIQEDFLFLQRVESGICIPLPPPGALTKIAELASAVADTGPKFNGAGLGAGPISRRTGLAARVVQYAARPPTVYFRDGTRCFTIRLPMEADPSAADSERRLRQARQNNSRKHGG